jgi:hypothetical protein
MEKVVKLVHSEQLVIEHDVPIPHKGGGRITKYPFRTMKRGDSFTVPVTEGTRLRAALYAWAKVNNKHNMFTTRKQGDVVRCWRIK